MVRFRVSARVSLEGGPWEVYWAEEAAASGVLPSLDEVAREIARTVARDHGLRTEDVVVEEVSVRPVE